MPPPCQRENEIAPMNKPVVAVTFGHASGIGPELVAKLLTRADALAAARIVLVGDAGVWAQGQPIAGPAPPGRIIRDWNETRPGENTPMLPALTPVSRAR